MNHIQETILAAVDRHGHIHHDEVTQHFDLTGLKSDAESAIHELYQNDRIGLSDSGYLYKKG